MLVPQKCQYAIRAVFELAKRAGQGPIKIADVAKAQAIPPRFLEVILSQLKQAGFVDSIRGNEGGYFLVRAPNELTVGDVLQFMQGPINPVDCVVVHSKDKCAVEKCSLYGKCVFLPMWEKVRDAICGVFHTTTFRDLVDQDRRLNEAYVASYAI